jgi:hypothetical protein
MKLRGAKSALIAALAIAFISCSWWSRRVKLGEQFAMRPQDKVAVAGTGLTIRLDEVGHQTFSGPSPPPSGASYVVLLVTSEDGSKSIRISVGDTAEIPHYVIKVSSAHPFRSDDGPRCELIVTSAGSDPRVAQTGPAWRS